MTQKIYNSSEEDEVDYTAEEAFLLEEEEK